MPLERKEPATTGSTDLRAEHTRLAIRRRLAKTQKRNYLRDAVFGAVDGTVTTFAVVSGVKGAQLPVEIALILGTTNLMADGFSMAIGNYLAGRTDKDYQDSLFRTEEAHIQNIPEGEREEVR